MAGVSDAPERAVAVLGHEQRPVVRHGHPHGPAPDTAVVHHEPGEKVFVFAGGNAVVETHAHHLLTGAQRAIP